MCSRKPGKLHCCQQRLDVLRLILHNLPGHIYQQCGVFKAFSHALIEMDPNGSLFQNCSQCSSSNTSPKSFPHFSLNEVRRRVANCVRLLYSWKNVKYFLGKKPVYASRLAA